MSIYLYPKRWSGWKNIHPKRYKFRNRCDMYCRSDKKEDATKHVADMQRVYVTIDIHVHHPRQLSAYINSVIVLVYNHIDGCHRDMIARCQTIIRLDVVVPPCPRRRGIATGVGSKILHNTQVRTTDHLPTSSAIRTRACLRVRTKKSMEKELRWFTDHQSKFALTWIT
jgi:hypothetical protein